MNPEQIIKELEFNTGLFPDGAVIEAVDNQEQITPLLLTTLEKLITKPDVLADDSYVAHLYAMYLLAQFREKRAYPLIIDFFSQPDETFRRSAGDAVTEDLHRILASVACGDSILIKELAENDRVDEYVRGSALEALLTQVVCGEANREEVMAYYANLFRKVLKREPSQVWNSLVDCCNELYPEEVLEDIKQAYAEGLVEEFYIDSRYIEESLARGKNAKLKETLADSRYTLIIDVVSDMDWWACFQQGDKREYLTDAIENLRTHYPEYYPQPYVRKINIGRNEPCPCGSGKKYKKCCGK
jgi:hypothetical protein